MRLHKLRNSEIRTSWTAFQYALVHLPTAYGAAERLSLSTGMKAQRRLRCPAGRLQTAPAAWSQPCIALRTDWFPPTPQATPTAARLDGRAAVTPNQVR